MIDIGIAGLDSSHPETFADRIEERDDARIGAVWDGGDVRDAPYVEEFCDSTGATPCDDVEELVSLADAAMVLTVDWDTHATLAERFLDAGVPTLVDKPVAGRLADVERLARAAESTPLFGGSSIPYHPSLADLLDAAAGQTLYCAGYNDPFYYGSHVADTVRHAAGADWCSVAPAADPGLSFDVLFEDDTYVTLRLDGPSPSDGGGFGFLGVGDRTGSVLLDWDTPGRQRQYDSYLDDFLGTVRRGSNDPGRLLDGATLLLAVHAAREAGRPVTPGSPALREFHADGAAFLDEYRRTH